MNIISEKYTSEGCEQTLRIPSSTCDAYSIEILQGHCYLYFPSFKTQFELTTQDSKSKVYLHNCTNTQVPIIKFNGTIQVNYLTFPKDVQPQPDLPLVYEDRFDNFVLVNKQGYVFPFTYSEYKAVLYHSIN